MNVEHIRVLIVDDDPEDANVFATSLRTATMPVYVHQHATSIEDAIKIMDSETFDVVLLDLGLSGSTGIATLDEFRSHNDQLPVVVLSGLDDDAVATQALQNDAQDYLVKGDVDARTLSRTIRYAIQRQNSLREHRRLLSRLRENEEILRRKNERLERLYETAHAFVDNVSHEFRTPLTVIKEYVSVVRDGTLGETNDDQTRFLRIAEDRADDLNTMVDDMLDVSKLEAGLLSVSRRPEQFGEVLDRIVPFLDRKAAVRELELAVEIAESLPVVYCDREKVERVVINLAVNAMKFTRRGGRIRIWAREQGDDVLVGVSDNGPGIAPASLRSIFERFRQVDTNVRSGTKGFGLGLNIAKELVSLNLGDIDVESDVGVGSTFSFTVPKYQPAHIAQRYLKRLSHNGSGFASVVTATIDPTSPETAADDIDVFLHYLIRSDDLCFRTDRHRWVMLMPEPASEVGLFIDRADRELGSVNRNRPRGPLPGVALRVDSSWSDLQITREEIVARLMTQIESGQFHQGECASTHEELRA